jgi:hypothetical protein
MAVNFNHQFFLKKNYQNHQLSFKFWIPAAHAIECLRDCSVYEFEITTLRKFNYQLHTLFLDRASYLTCLPSLLCTISFTNFVKCDALMKESNNSSKYSLKNKIGITCKLNDIYFYCSNMNHMTN